MFPRKSDQALLINQSLLLLQGIGGLELPGAALLDEAGTPIGLTASGQTPGSVGTWVLGPLAEHFAGWQLREMKGAAWQTGELHHVHFWGLSVLKTEEILNLLPKNFHSRRFPS